jgi:hypothetical protein
MIWLKRSFITVFLTSALSAVAIGQLQSVATEEENEDRLSPAEEEYAYAAKGPAARVAAFLNIAQKKIERAKNLHQKDSGVDLNESLQGYVTALRGANTAISWGKHRGEDMQRHTAAVAKAVRKHITVLEKLSAETSPRNRRLLARICQVLNATQEPGELRQNEAWESGAVERVSGR